MRYAKIISILALIILPFLSIYYKVKVKDVSLIPQAATDLWNLETSFLLKQVLADSDEDKIILPLPDSWHNQHLESREVFAQTPYRIIFTKKGQAIELERSKMRPERLTIMSQIRISALEYGVSVSSSIEYAATDEDLAAYTSMDDYEEELLNSLKELRNKISPLVGESDRDYVKRLYLYTTEEILHNEEIRSLAEAIKISEGSSFVRSKLLVALARLRAIPARINLGMKMERQENENKLLRVFYPEVLLNKRWYPLDLDSKNFMQMPSDVFTLERDVSRGSLLLNPKHSFVKSSPVMVDRVDSSEYKAKLAGISSALSKISFHNLPISLQSVFATVLLIPIGTLILSFGRNIVGLNTFGIFTPILLSLFFMETSLVTGVIFFLFIVLIGFFQRFLLDRFYLLAVPRLSILLTLVIMSFGALSLLTYQENSFLEGGALNYFPIVIIAVFIERFSVDFVEEGWWNTAKTLAGTFLIAFICGMIFSNRFLKILLFNHPELLLVTLGLNILIGSYKGYRFSELLRFREFAKIKD